jgi:glycosyltransferase involved in cell wall biosynthesis
MKQDQLVSVCIPSYNGEAYLGPAIESALAQTYTNIEILIIDDCSRDNSLEIADQYSATDRRIRFYRNPERLGLVGNWNRCIEESRGEWIKFLFQDDLLDPKCLSMMLADVESSSGDYRVVFSKRDFIFESNVHESQVEDITLARKFIWDISPNIARVSPRDTAYLLTRYPCINIFGEPTSFLLHKTVFEEFGLFDANIAHYCDLEYWLRIGVNLPMKFVPKTLVYFRIHSESATASNSKNKYFHLRYLDRVKLFSKFSSHRVYEPLRLYMCNWPANKLINSQLSIFVRRARIAVQRSQEESWKIELERITDVEELLKESKRCVFMVAVEYLLSSTSFRVSYWLGKAFSKKE